MLARTIAACALITGCSFSSPGSDAPAPGADAGSSRGDASEVGTDAGADCVPLPSGAMAWWDGELLGVDRLDQYPMSQAFEEPTVEPGLVGNAMTLEEDEDIIFDPAPQAAAFTVEGWIRRQKDDTDWVTVYGNGDDAGVFLFDHKLTYYDADTSGNGNIALGATTIPLDTFVHVGAVYNGPNITLYVDGVEDGTGNAGGVAVNLPEIGRVGGVTFDVGDGDGNDFVGQVDELTIYNRPLEPAELAAIAAAGAGGKCKP